MGLKSSVIEFLKIDELKDNFMKLLEAKFELKKLEITEQIHAKSVDIIYLLAKLLLGLLLYLFASISVATVVGIYWAMPLLGVGFFVIFHIILLMLFIIFKNPVKAFISTQIAKFITNSNP